MRALPRVPLLALAALAGCAALDITQPIALRPEADWDASSVAALNRAAACWNQLGTQLLVKPGATFEQEVTVAFEDFVCTHASATTFPNLPVAVYVCPPRYWDRNLPLGYVLTHELGHVLNIRTHASDPRSIMGSSEETVGRWFNSFAFTVEDLRLLREANPGFVPTADHGRCD